MKEERVRASRLLPAGAAAFGGDRAAAVQDIHDALYAAKICSYAQGYMLMRAAGAEYGWDLSFGDIALMWRGGCIIRSRFLNDIKAAYDRDPTLENLLQDPFFRGEIERALPGWRRAAVLSIQLGVPAPAFTSALAFYDGYRAEHLPASLIQAQRDYFGAHAYERLDRPRGEFFHTDWAGGGPATASKTYSA
jgi:6-phosphogluconate dehydrogenase